MKKIMILVGLLSFISLAMAAGLTVSVSDSTGANGSTSKVPVNLEGASDIGSMDIVLKYDATVLKAVSAEAGELGKNAFIEANTAKEGEVKIALADSSGINGDGTVATISFEVIGEIGSTSPLTLETVSVHSIELVEIVTAENSGTFTVTEETSLFGFASVFALAIIAIITIIAALFIIKKKK